MNRWTAQFVDLESTAAEQHSYTGYSSIEHTNSSNDSERVPCGTMVIARELDTKVQGPKIAGIGLAVPN